jgi:hypothetical protein
VGSRSAPNEATVAGLWRGVPPLERAKNRHSRAQCVRIRAEGNRRGAAEGDRTRRRRDPTNARRFVTESNSDVIMGSAVTPPHRDAGCMQYRSASEFCGQEDGRTELKNFVYTLTPERLGRFDIDFRKVMFIRGYVPTSIIYRTKPQASSVPTRYLVRMEVQFAAQPTISRPILAMEKN